MATPCGQFRCASRNCGRREFGQPAKYLSSASAQSFSSFSAKERSDIAENLGEVWGVEAKQVSDVINRETTAEEHQMLSELEDFDFDDI